MATTIASTTFSLISTPKSHETLILSISSSSRFSSSSSFTPSLSLSFSLFLIRPLKTFSKFVLVVSPSADTKKVLIVNTNSGGHAVIGFYFAKELLSFGHDVTVLTVGDQGFDKMNRPPFSKFSELTIAGGKTVWGDPAEVGKAVGEAAFDVVLDNNVKDFDIVKYFLFADTYGYGYNTVLNCRPVADWTKSAGVTQFLYIRSAGIYNTSEEVPHVEGDVVKESASHVAVEKYIEEIAFTSWSIFRPQYMIGSGNNKDCEEWFFDCMLARTLSIF